MIKIYVQFVKIRVENNNRWTVTDDSSHSANNIKHIIILKFLFVGWVELKTLTLTNNMILCSIICLFLCLFFPCLGIFYQASAFSQMTKIFILFILFIKRSDFFITKVSHLFVTVWKISRKETVSRKKVVPL